MDKYVFKNIKTNKYIYWKINKLDAVDEIEVEIEEADKFNKELSDIIFSTLEPKYNYILVDFNNEIRKLKLEKLNKTLILN